MSEEIFLSIIIPVYNEEKRIDQSLKELKAYLNILEYPTELIIVNDGSEDKTSKILNRWIIETNILTVINLYKNKGKGYAVKVGVMKAKGKYILFCDADLSTPLTEINKFLNVIKNGYDVIFASRKLANSIIRKKQPMVRNILSMLFNKVVSIFFVKNIKDTQCGFKMFTRDAARTIFDKISVNSYVFDVEILCIAQQCSLIIVEKPIEWRHMPHSKLHNKKSYLRIIRDLVILFYKYAKVNV